MGFAGQVFAAKMAVGLAVPSAGALSRTGGLLAKGAAGIYSALNSQIKAQAQKRVADAQAEVDRLCKIASDASAQSSQFISNAAVAGMKRIEAAGGDAAAVMEKSGAGAFQGMKQAMGKEGSKLFEGLEKAATGVQRLEKITSNYTKMTKNEQKAAIKNSKEYVTARTKAVKTDKEALANKIKELNELKASSDKRTKVFKKQEAEINKEITQLQKRIEVGRELRDEAIAEADILGRVVVQATNALGYEQDIATKATEALDEATGELAEAQAELEDSTKELTESSANFGAVVVDTVNTSVNNFKEVLLETTATLTAFYYKLNQNTEALIEYERELLNANSVWQETDEVLFAAGEQVTQFGQTFGLNMQNGATGLYQLASAGLTAQESMDVLGNTLKLSMAVQGDHNTIAKLTTQTLRGFDMEMTQSAEVTDKFAHAIQKSLIEYEDLSSAVKFALPFFTSTGQSIDQLLGSLQILTNRALEAGIAGRGLRQALAEFAEGAEENSEKFAEMGINILDAEGNMKQLTDIAMEFHTAVGENIANDTELLTTLIDKLNVRGATAFVHLVQNAEEFQQAVDETAQAGGELDKMVDVQNESLSAQLQILKNNAQFIFQMADATYVADGYMNKFHKTVTLMIADLQGLIVEGEEGNKQLTDFGLAIQDIAVSGMEALHELLLEIVPVIKEFSKEGFLNVEMIRLYTLPMRILVDLLDIMGPHITKMLLSFYVMNKILPITTALEIARNVVMIYYLKMLAAAIPLKTAEVAVEEAGFLAKSKSYALDLKDAALKPILSFLDTARTATLTSVTVATWGYVMALGGYIKTAIVATWATIKLGAATMVALLPYILVGAAIAGVIYWIGKLIWNTGVLQDAWTAFTEPGGTLYKLSEAFGTFIVMLQATWELMKFIGGGIGNIVQGARDFVGVLKAIPAKLFDFGNIGVPGMATGGYITPMASGGMAGGGGAYLVGERGPELFRPNGGGQVLNNTATNHILADSTDRGFSGTGGGMVVSNLTVESAEMNQSNLNIDSFAGNPAMKRRAL